MNFALVDDSLFSAFSRPQAIKETETNQSSAAVQFNYCIDCNIPMEIVDFEYQCSVCGQLSKNDFDAVANHNDSSSGPVRITTGSHKGRYYNTINDYAKTQHRDVLELLMVNKSQYIGPAIPDDAIRSTASKYNELQKMIVECGEINLDQSLHPDMETKKFVKRSSMRAEILAALLESYCNLAGAPRDKRDIARFMGLSTDGFSRGQKVIDDINAMHRRNVAGKSCSASNIPDLVIGEKTAKMWAERYLEALNIDPETAEKYVAFVCDVVAESDRKKVCVSSRLSSKVVGAIWTIIVKKKLPITAKQLENATDNTKKNTFIKFHEAIIKSPAIFGAICRSHGF